MEGRWGDGTGAAAEGAAEAAAADIARKRRNVCGGLGHVKKRLWGSMFEGRYVRVMCDADNMKKSLLGTTGELISCC